MIIELTDNRGDVFVNTDHIIYYRDTPHGTELILTNGGLLVVEECPHVISSLVQGEDFEADEDDDPAWDIMRDEYRIDSGSLIPNSEVMLTNISTFRNGETVSSACIATFTDEHETLGEPYYGFADLKYLLKDGQFTEPHDCGIPARYFADGGAPTPLALREADNG